MVKRSYGIDLSYTLAFWDVHVVKCWCRDRGGWVWSLIILDIREIHLLTDTVSGTSTKLLLARVDLDIFQLNLDTSFFCFVSQELNQQDIP